MRKSDKIQGGFIVVPKNTLNDKEYIALTDSAKLVYQAMLTKFKRGKDNPEWKVKITQKQIKELTGKSRSTIYRAIDLLKTATFVEVPPEDQGGLEREPTIYTLVKRWLL